MLPVLFNMVNFDARQFSVGTTWTQQIIHQLLRGGESGGFYGETVPWLEATASDFLQPREAPTWTLDKINSAPLDSPRYFKTHATVNHLPRGDAKIKGEDSFNILGRAYEVDLGCRVLRDRRSVPRSIANTKTLGN